MNQIFANIVALCLLGVGVLLKRIRKKPRLAFLGVFICLLFFAGAGIGLIQPFIASANHSATIASHPATSSCDNGSDGNVSAQFDAYFAVSGDSPRRPGIPVGNTSFCGGAVCLSVAGPVGGDIGYTPPVFSMNSIDDGNGNTDNAWDYRKSLSLKESSSFNWDVFIYFPDGATYQSATWTHNTPAETCPPPYGYQSQYGSQYGYQSQYGSQYGYQSQYGSQYGYQTQPRDLSPFFID